MWKNEMNLEKFCVQFPNILSWISDSLTRFSLNFVCVFFFYFVLDIKPSLSFILQMFESSRIILESKVILWNVHKISMRHLLTIN